MINSRVCFLKESAGKKIVLYGAGEYAKNAVSFLESEGIYDYLIIDSAPDKWGKVLLGGRTILSPDILKELDGNEAVVMISSKNFSREIKSYISGEFPEKFDIYIWPLSFENTNFDDEKIRHERLYKPCEQLYEEIAAERADKDEYVQIRKCLLEKNDALILPRTPLIITTKCSLRCRECSNLIPHFQNPRDYPAEEIEKWVKNVENAVDDWIVLELVGGEPFLHCDFDEILDYVLSVKKISRIEIATNASVVPREELLTKMQNDKVLLKISEYPGVVDNRGFLSVINGYGIRYQLFKNMRWSKTEPLTTRNRSRQTIRSQYMNCGVAKMCR